MVLAFNLNAYESTLFCHLEILETSPHVGQHSNKFFSFCQYTNKNFAGAFSVDRSSSVSSSKDSENWLDSIVSEFELESVGSIGNADMCSRELHGGHNLFNSDNCFCFPALRSDKTASASSNNTNARLPPHNS